jgi:hypothetical protein
MTPLDMPRAQDTSECTRHLIHVPILHTPADMGSSGEGLEAAYVERFGRRHWDEYLHLVQGFWQSVRDGLDQPGLDYHQVDLYQDGLPVCGKEEEIVRKAAAMGSQNHQLLLDLVGRGATLVGTEDPLLLLEEYHSVQAALFRGPGAACAPDEVARHEETLSRRDAYIARRIDQTLRPGRTGVLLLGMMHNVESFLPADVVTRRLVPPTRRGRIGAE